MKLTVEALEKLRKEAAKKLTLRQGQPKVKITVHMGDCGIAAGARRVMDALLEALLDMDRPDIQVLAAGCIQRCDGEPIVTVEIDESPKTSYQKMDPEKIRRVVSGHILKGETQTDLLLPPA